MSFGEHPGLVVLLAGFLTGGILMGIGLGRLWRALGRVKSRVDGYGELGLEKQVELAQARVAVARRSAETLPGLLSRAGAALDESRRALARVRFMLQAARALLRVFTRGAASGARAR